MRIVLTDKKLRSLKPAPKGKQTVYHDALIPNFAVRVRDSGVASFVMSKRWPGGAKEPTPKTIGRVGLMSLAEAREKAKAWHALLEKGIDPKREEERARRATHVKEVNTFGVVAEDYIKRKLPGQRRAKAVEAEVRRDLIKFWEHRPITEITKRDVVKRIEAIKDRGAATQAHTIFGHCRLIFNWAINRDIYGLEVNPCDRLRPRDLIGAKMPRQRVLTDGELASIWIGSEKLGYPWTPMFRLLMLTGQRRSEVSGMRWREFSEEARIWTIPPERFKSNAVHVIPLSDDALAVIATCPHFTGGDCVFTAKNGSTPAHCIDLARYQLDKIIETDFGAKVPNWTLHDIRRTVRTRLSALRVPSEVAEMVIGHGKKGLARVYDQHEFADEMREALDAWAALLRSIVNPPPANVVALRG